MNPWRLDTVQRAIRSSKYTPFKKLMIMTRAELYDPKTIGQNYAQSWSMIYFFWHYDKGKYSKNLQAYFKSLRKGAGLREAFKAGFGKMNFPAVEKEWRDYVMKLRK